MGISSGENNLPDKIIIITNILVKLPFCCAQARYAPDFMFNFFIPGLIFTKLHTNPTICQLVLTCVTKFPFIFQQNLQGIEALHREMI